MPDMGDEVKLSFLRWLMTEDQQRQDNYRAYREYYDGDHDTQLTDRQRAYLQVKTSADFNDNFCPVVVDALAERLQVTGFSAADDDQGEIFWQWWEANGMDGTQGQVHLSAIRDGDAYVMVEWDSEENLPRFTMELSCCDGQGVKVHYSNERRGEIAFASKRWRQTQGTGAGYIRRMNLYYPNRIEKYISNQEVSEGDWQPYEEEDGAWPLWWTETGTESGVPLGVPIVHFRNKDQGYDYGTSELKNVIPLQNALNKSIIDLLAAADTTAFRIFWMLGDDPSGVKVAPGSWIYSTKPPGGDEGVQVGMFDGEDMRPLIQLKDSFAVDIARVSRTPLNAFQVTGQVASEGTLKQQDAGLISKAENRMVYFGNGWERTMKVARRLANVFGTGFSFDERQIVSTLWNSAVTRDETEELERAKIKHELGVPRITIWREIGYNDDQIDEMMLLKQQEQLQGAQLAQAYLDEARRNFDQNGSGEEEAVDA